MKSEIQSAFNQGKGILKLKPTWVPRGSSVPGKRIRLHPNDYYVFGNRGTITERWIASTVHADNGPGTPEDEGLSYIALGGEDAEKQILLKEAVQELKGELIGAETWDEYQRWPAFSKFFDNKGALPFHLHHRKEQAEMLGQTEKPEAYFFPAQMNNYDGDFPYTFLGLQPDTTKEQFMERMKMFGSGDNRITELSIAYRLILDTSWNVPAGVLHAPGSLCTYEPQWASDVGAVYQSLIGGQLLSDDMLWSNAPKDRIKDYDYLLELVDWESNIDPDFREKNFMVPVPVYDEAEMKSQGFLEQYICYRSKQFAAKELTVFPGKEVEIKDGSAYGLIVLQGRGTVGVWDVDAPTMIRFGQMTNDEFYVSDSAAKSGVKIKNTSAVEPLVMLKQFGPKHGFKVDSAA